MFELITFICGFAVMTLEIAGARLVAPYIGTSFIVWTTLIGTVMLYLSIGYWLGGKMADKQASVHFLSKILFGAASYIILVAILQYHFWMGIINLGIFNVYFLSVLVSVVLFAVPSLLLGVVSPYVMKLAINERNIDCENTGKLIGKFGAISTIGSILGTFLCGFVFIIFFGVSKISELF